MKKSEFYDAVWERLIALKSYNLVSTENKNIRFTKNGIEFLKHENKEYYLGKVLLMNKYKRTKHPGIVIECFHQFAELTNRERESIKRVLSCGYEDIKERDWIIWSNFIQKIKSSEKGKLESAGVIGRVCSDSLRKITVGTKAPIDIPIPILKKITKELVEAEGEIEKDKKIMDKSSLIVKNLLELHLEEVIRRNFISLFPYLKIIDNSQHYYTNDGDYIDILCKNKNDDSYVVIELKRDRSPSRALIQLLDYVNQIMEEFKTKKVKGILICKQIDRRTKSALTTLRKKLKDPDGISIFEFNLKMGINKV